MPQFPSVADIVAQHAGPMVYFTNTNLPKIVFELIYTSGGGPVVLKQGATDATARCAVARDGSKHSVTMPTATVIDSNNGFVEIDWGSFKFTAPGVYEAQVEVTMPDGTILPTQRLTINVQLKVGGL